MKRLSKRQVLLLHDQLLAQTGGTSGLRDEGLLESALSAPFQGFAGADAYPSLPQKAARLCYGLVKTTRLWTAISASAPTPCWCSWQSMV